ncbi:MAG: hypothetical protein IJ240_03250, partial [Clostridia bacterium]|nr:hypothetical protein [Clostridia bacterium]
MNALDPIRIELRSLMGSIGFLRLDRDDRFLFISDLPRRKQFFSETQAALEQNGFTACIDPALLLHIDLTEARWRRLMTAAPAQKLWYCFSYPTLSTQARIWIERETPVHLQPILPLRMTLKLLDTGELGTLARRLPPWTAEQLRL